MGYVWEGLLLEGYLCLRFGWLIFRRVFFFRGGGGLLSKFYGIPYCLMVSRQFRRQHVEALQSIVDLVSPTQPMREYMTPRLCPHWFP